MRLVHRPIEAWPGEMTPPGRRRRADFRRKASGDSWRRERVPLGDTLDLLNRELRALGVRHEAVLQLAVGERDIRLDGQVRANATPAHPGIILNFKAQSVDGAPELSYACDTFDHWHDNLRAVAKGLEALRLVDRYGVGGGRQYTGYKALGAGMPMGPATMTVEEAARLLCDAAEVRPVLDDEDPADIARVASVARSLWREAAKTLHPDVGGDPDLFRRLTEARDLLLREAGRS